MNRREALNLSAITALGLALPGSTLEARAQGALSRTAARRRPSAGAAGGGVEDLRDQ